MSRASLAQNVFVVLPSSMCGESMIWRALIPANNRHAVINLQHVLCASSWRGIVRLRPRHDTFVPLGRAGNFTYRRQNNVVAALFSPVCLLVFKTHLTHPALGRAGNFTYRRQNNVVAALFSPVSLLVFKTHRTRPTSRTMSLLWRARAHTRTHTQWDSSRKKRAVHSMAIGF